MQISVGKMRGLMQCATPQGVFSILALDHRNNLRRALYPDNPDSATPQELINIKTAVSKVLSNQASATLLDPQFGAPYCLSTDSLPGNRGLIVSLEATGYVGDADNRMSQILPQWSVHKIKMMGASGVKLLVYYHPEADQAQAQKKLVEQVGKTCKDLDIPFFLEPLTYSLDPDRKLFSTEKKQIVIETAKQLSPLGADVMKMEFPLNTKETPDEKAWADACSELSSALEVPWVLLSAGVDFDDYLDQVTIACRAGASGVMAGRAVWKEAIGLRERPQFEFLNTVASQRMYKLSAICNALAKPWRDFFQTDHPGPKWYLEYQEK